MSVDDGDAAAPAVSGSAVTLLAETFDGGQVTALRHAVRRRALDAGLSGDRLDDFVLAVNELATNAVRHGGGSGHLMLRHDGDSLVCEVADNGGGVVDPAMAASGPPAGDHPGGRGLFLANRLADGLMLTNRADGLTASVVVCVEPASVLSTISQVRPASAP